MEKDRLELMVSKAISGDRLALEKVVLSIKDLVFNLSLKMLLFPEDAKDATQEILIKVITHLSTFKKESQFTTWVYRVATNYLLTAKSKKSEEVAMPFEDYANMIDTGQSDIVTYAQNEGELKLLEEEVKVSCTHGLLLCLNKQGRLVYILSEILEFNSLEGAEILEISSGNFRKILSRSREKIRGFMQKKCGLVDTKNSCRCKRKIDFLIGEEMIDPRQLQFARPSNRSIDLIEKIDSAEKSVVVFRSVQDYKTPQSVMQEVRKTIRSINM